MKLENKKIIIAFDGVDNVGKSTQITLVQKWLAHIPLTMTYLNKPRGATNTEKLEYGIMASRNHLLTKRSIWNLGIGQIAHRMHYTEYAYSILRGGHNLETLVDLEREFIDMKPDFFTIIFIDKAENISAREDGTSAYDHTNLDEIQSVSDRFVEISKHSLFDNIVINIHNKNIPTVHQEVQIALLKKFPDILK